MNKFINPESGQNRSEMQRKRNGEKTIPMRSFARTLPRSCRCRIPRAPAFLLSLPVLLLAFFLSSCTTGGSGTTTDNYFTGYDGVAMRFLPGTPNVAYYYTTPYQTGDNTFSFNVEVADKGSADTYGGLYISGYDPGFIKVDGVSVDHQGSGFDCDFETLGIGTSWLGSIACTLWGSTVTAATNGQGQITDITANIRGRTWEEIFGKDSKAARFLRGLELTFEVDPQTKRGGFGVDFSNPSFDFGMSSNGRVAIAYFNSVAYGLISRTFIDPSHGREFTLIGDRQNYPGGEQDIITFNAEVKTWPRGLVQTDQTFLITSCYVYTTYADPQVCVDPFPESSDRKVCKPKKITYPRGQGGPVAVTSIEQLNTPRAIIFTINVANKGKGLIYHPVSLVKCDPLNAERVTAKDLNFVFLGDIRMPGSDRQFQCQPENRMIRLDDKGQGVITCEYPIEFAIKSAYQTPLIVSLWYGYSETIQKKVQLKRAN